MLMAQIKSLTCGQSFGSSFVAANRATILDPQLKQFSQYKEVERWSGLRRNLISTRPPRLQCNTQLSLRSGVSPSGLRAQDGEIPNLASLLTISSPNLSGSDPCQGRAMTLFKGFFFLMRSVSHCFQCSCCRSDSPLAQRHAQL